MEQLIAEYKGSTKNKIIWSTYTKNVEFRFYIPKGKIPKPIPKKILISIYHQDDSIQEWSIISKFDAIINPSLRKRKICSKLKK